MPTFVSSRGPKRFPFRYAAIYCLARLSMAILVLIGGVLGGTLQADEFSEGTIQRLTRSHFPKFFLQYSPDGSHLVYSRQYDNRRAANKILVGLRIVKSDGTGDRPLLPEFDAQVQIQEHPAWSPDGKRLVLSGGGNDTGNATKDLFVCDVNQQFQATDLRKLAGVGAAVLGEEPAWSPDGRQVAYVTTTEQLWVVQADGKNKTMVLQVAGQYCHQPAWSPDGEWIAFASDHEGNVELYKVRSDGSDLTRLTEAPGIDCRPRWSRDAQWILFSSNRDGNFDLFLMRADGTDARPLTRHTALDDHGVWSPDGRGIAFVSLRDGGFDLYRLALPGDVVLAAGPPSPLDDEPAVGPTGLVAHYDFDGRTPADARRDRAGRNHLQWHGTKLIQKEGRGALEFDGATSYASAGNPEALRLQGPLSLSFWIRPAPQAGNGYLLSKHGWNVYLGTDLAPRFETRSANDTAWDTLAASQPLPSDSWSYVVALFDPQQRQIALYVNGQLAAERARTDGALGATAGFPLELGHYNQSRTQKFRGRLDEIRIYNRALPKEEIAQEYERQLPRVVER
ncbi:MAG: LpqB family beta-propeller domain-containing protein [Planctomycetales bacterium]